MGRSLGADTTIPADRFGEDLDPAGLGAQTARRGLRASSGGRRRTVATASEGRRVRVEVGTRVARHEIDEARGVASVSRYAAATARRARENIDTTRSSRLIRPRGCEGIA